MALEEWPARARWLLTTAVLVWYCTCVVRIDVNGGNADPVYVYLKKEAGGLITAIPWNFAKVGGTRPSQRASEGLAARQPVSPLTVLLLCLSVCLWYAVPGGGRQAHQALRAADQPSVVRG